MIDDLDAVAAVLRGTVLEGHPVEAGPGGTVLVTGVDDDRVLEGWQAARREVPVTGRWPVVTVATELIHEPDPARLTELDAAALALDPWTVFQRWVNTDPVSVGELDDYTSEFFHVYLGAQAAQRLTMPTTWPEAERWIYEQVLADPALAAAVERSVEYLVGTTTWYKPRQPVQVVLLPTASPWLTPGWLGYFGAYGRERELAAALWQWQQRYGAELVASWGTMLQFLVDRPPAAGEPAWQVAGQLKAVGGNLQMPQWMLALAVARSEAWFLHDRP